MLKLIALTLVAGLVLLPVYIALQPAEFAIERTAAIQAPPSVIYPHVQSLRAMNEWSPFAKADPDMKLRYDGPDAGVGASSTWESAKVGSGSSTITRVQPNQEVEMRLDFRAPMEATNTARFTLQPEGDVTRVTWRMEGRRGFLAKAFGLVMNMDKVVGGEFEKGLASMKTLAEAESRVNAAAGKAP
jgi:Polyketide cyclase / dehydrase and lipid transport